MPSVLGVQVVVKWPFLLPRITVGMHEGSATVMLCIATVMVPEMVPFRARQRRTIRVKSLQINNFLRQGMRLLILSDLHIEFQALQPAHTDADIVVLAGDIHSGGRTIDWVKQAFPSPDRPVVLVLGNHDYWDHTDISGALDKAREETVGTHIHLLENDAVTLAGIRFLGCTLWTDYRLTGNQPLATIDAQRRINDFKRIRGPGDDELIPADIEYRHQQSRAWLQRELETGHDGPTVVVTHHAPSLLSIPERYRAQKSSHLMAAYASSMEHFCGTADLWIHGHIHESVEYDMAGTRIVSNPRGYGPKALNRDFDPRFCVQVNRPPQKAGSD